MTFEHSSDTEITDYPSVSTPAESFECKFENAIKDLAQVTDEGLQRIENSNPIQRWITLAAPVLKSGGKPVALIIALGFIAIPLSITGNLWVSPILAVGAVTVAISSCWHNF